MSINGEDIRKRLLRGDLVRCAERHGIPTKVLYNLLERNIAAVPPQALAELIADADRNDIGKKRMRFLLMRYGIMYQELRFIGRKIDRNARNLHSCLLLKRAVVYRNIAAIIAYIEARENLGISSEGASKMLRLGWNGGDIGWHIHIAVRDIDIPCKKKVINDDNKDIGRNEGHKPVPEEDGTDRHV